MAVDDKKRRDRWRRNKREQRSRKKPIQPSPLPISTDFADLVWKERNKRVKNFPLYLAPLPEGRYYPRNLSSASHPFICDVWAVLTLFKSQNSAARISAGMVADFLKKHGRSHGLKDGSIRTKVWRAIRVIEYLEDTPAREGNGPYWPKFPGSVADHGSGVMQHVKDVFRDLELLGMVPAGTFNRGRTNNGGEND